MDDFSCSFSGPGNSLQGFDISYHMIDYLVRLHGASGRYASVIIRGPMGGEGIVEASPEVPELLRDIVVRESGVTTTLKFPGKPVVIFNEHESSNEGETRLIFYGIKGCLELQARMIRFVKGILEFDETITLCPDQLSLFEKNYKNARNPVFLPNEDFQRIKTLCIAITKIQRKHYQGEVDRLLSILPPL